jgi:hypothetical protein
VTTVLLPLLVHDREEPIPEHTSILTGHMYYRETMENPNPNVFWGITRMKKETFVQLLQMLIEKGKLVDGRMVTAGEKIFILIHVLIGHSLFQTASRFQHSKETIHKIVYEVIHSLLLCKSEFFRQPEAGDFIPFKIYNNPDFYPFFIHCIGALDGTHVPAQIDAASADPFRNRKGWLSQNVLAVCDFDMLFTFVLPGWEGCAHDAKVLLDGWRRGLLCPPGKYYLGDSGYSLSWQVLTPYRGVRYHLKE